MRYFLILFTLFLFACETGNESVMLVKRNSQPLNNSNPEALFNVLNAKKTGLRFSNEVHSSIYMNYLNYMHIYMGAGVGVGDFNNDGLDDIYFVGNIEQDRLYINEGNLKFKDITESSGIASDEHKFSTGVSLVDINSDGYLDIYLPRSGAFNEKEFIENKLYINNGDLTFTEKAAEYGLNDPSHTTQTIFFDYDRDNDLDAFIVNTPVDFNLTSAAIDVKDIRSSTEALNFGGADILLRNDNGKFTNVSSSSGIQIDISFGLQAAITDYNQDGWLDIYISNDFLSPDQMYRNNGDGTFTEVAEELFHHTSFYSMGSDWIDINNDNQQDLIVLDMSFSSHKDSKTSMKMLDRKQYWQLVDMGYNYQYMHNMLHLNNGNESFSEVSQMTGIDKTEWSWSVLGIDFDYDQLKDLHITNGIQQNVLHRDGMEEVDKMMKFYKQRGTQITPEEFDKMTSLLPEFKQTNYFFKNLGNLEFKKMNGAWANESPGLSNGSAYSDFDNDGDVDIVLNNVNQKAQILENLASDKQLNNFIQIDLEFVQGNLSGIGTIVNVKTPDGIVQSFQNTPVKGYLSTSDQTIYAGLGKNETIEKITVTWPNGNKQDFSDIQINQRTLLKYKNTASNLNEIQSTKPLLIEKQIADINQKEQIFDDFSKQILLPHKLSQYGPKIATGDINKDGKTDFYFPGSFDSNGRYFLSANKGMSEIKSFYKNSRPKEEVISRFMDVDNDGDLDLYIGCGSYEFDMDAGSIVDYIMINDRRGNFSYCKSCLPIMYNNTSVIESGDYNNDGNIDLFVGSKFVSGSYPDSPTSYLLSWENNQFKIVKEFSDLGMINDAKWLDVDGDNDLDLMLAGEWTPITILENKNGEFINSTLEYGLAKTNGWWNKIKLEDLDNDGDLDAVVGNLGLNYKFHASLEKPFHLYSGDFDDNGERDIVLAKDSEGKMVPVRGKDCSTEQIPWVSTKFTTFNDFADASIFDIYGEGMEDATHFQAFEFHNSILINNNGSFELKYLPVEAQVSAIDAIETIDINADGNMDVIIAGNLGESEIETTKGDAGIGLVLLSDGKNNFKPLTVNESGFYTPGNVKDIAILDRNTNPTIVVSRNNDKVLFFKLNKD